MDDLLDKLLDSLGTNRNAQIVLERNGAWHIHEVLEDEDEPVSE
jgi:hypothetical protein